MLENDSVKAEYHKIATLLLHEFHKKGRNVFICSINEARLKTSRVV